MECGIDVEMMDELSRCRQRDESEDATCLFRHRHLFSLCVSLEILQMKLPGVTPVERPLPGDAVEGFKARLVCLQRGS